MKYTLIIPNKKLDTGKKVSFKKVDIGTMTELAGAGFDLYQRDAPVTDTDVPYIAGLVSGADGFLTASEGGQKVFELPIGSYQLVETQVPRGYIKKQYPVTITITGDNGDAGISYDEGTSVSADRSGISYDEDTEVYTLIITNTTGVELPSTGGFSTALFRHLGILLLVLGGTGFTIKKKRRALPPDWRRRYRKTPVLFL